MAGRRTAHCLVTSTIGADEADPLDGTVFGGIIRKLKVRSFRGRRWQYCVEFEFHG